MTAPAQVRKSVRPDCLEIDKLLGAMLAALDKLYVYEVSARAGRLVLPLVSLAIEVIDRAPTDRAGALSSE
jgi:hypothetical protein